MTSGGEEAGRRELRLALVLYGGVSLCIYMHGTTKEIHRLVKASATLTAGLGEQGSPSEAVYGKLLRRMAETDREGVRTEVVVDIIAGTSAGGINGVFLAKALAHNLNQDGLRDLWMRLGDIGWLLRGWRRLPAVVRAPFVLARLPFKAPLRGGEMSEQLHRALASMDDRAPTPSTIATLVPEAGALELFVTMTDFYGYDRQVAIGDPKIVHDDQHRHVFRFFSGEQGDTFAGNGNVALAFAARATSCFPGAFAAVSRRSFYGDLPPDAGAIEDSFFRIYALSGADVDETYFIDGGVLDNRPFDLAIKAIRAKPADVDVERKLLYLDPDPAPPTGRAPAVSPGTIPSLTGSVSGLPRKQPILDSLLEVDRLNARVREVRDVIELSFAHVTAQVESAVAGALVGASDAATLSARQDQLHAVAREDTGGAYAVYVRARIAGVVGNLARTACAVCDYPAESNQAMLVAAVLHQWAEDRGLFADALPPSEAQLAFLRGLDVEYGQRRARFALAGINWWYEKAPEPGYPTRSQLDAVKRRLWSAVGELRAALADGAAQLSAELAACFPEGEITSFIRQSGLDAVTWTQLKGAAVDRFTATLADRLRPTLDGFDLDLHRDLLALTGEWSAERRHDLFVRYLGFPFWDVQLYPLQSVIGAGERDAIEVIRMSPLDAGLLKPKEGSKLKGSSFGHFGAFFKRAWRESDYLIGRLDGAERLITLLLGESHPERAQWCGRAFLAILEEEEPALKTAAALIAELRKQARELVPDP
jgi:patatin-related protein